MIRSFRDEETERLFSREGSRKLTDDIQNVALRRLAILDAAETLQDLAIPPGNRLNKLPGDRAGQRSIRINDCLRICFRWSDGDAHDCAGHFVPQQNIADFLKHKRYYNHSGQGQEKEVDRRLKGWRKDEKRADKAGD